LDQWRVGEKESHLDWWWRVGEKESHLDWWWRVGEKESHLDWWWRVGEKESHLDWRWRVGEKKPHSDLWRGLEMVPMTDCYLALWSQLCSELKMPPQTTDYY
jgi:hypothetical protein